MHTSHVYNTNVNNVKVTLAGMVTEMHTSAHTTAVHARELMWMHACRPNQWGALNFFAKVCVCAGRDGECNRRMQA